MPNLDHQTYGSGVAFIFIFNLIVGTGAIAMPSSFSDAGWLASSIVVTLICISSYISLTFVIESVSIANYIHKSDTCMTGSINPTNEYNDSEDEQSVISSNLHKVERAPLIDSNDLNIEQVQDDSHLFDITEKMELGHMAIIFFKKEYLKYFYLCVCLYLYGDLCIYSTAISKSLRDVTCSYENCSKSELNSNDLCWQDTKWTRSEVYRSYILILGLILPFFNLHSKYFQFLTTVFRWCAFSSMSVLCSIALIQGKGEGSPPKSSLIHLPNLFGVCVYSFMCHHSLPRLITPLKNKSALRRLIAFDYATVLFFYLFLSLTGVFTFSKVEDVYTLNFQKPRCSSANLIDDEPNVPQFRILELFLPLFPVFTLSTNIPIIAITLTNNLKALLLKETRDLSILEQTFIKIFFPLIVFLPPIVISYLSENVELIVGITGSYGGSFIQYLIPLFLVYSARNSLKRMEDEQEQLSLQNAENLDNSFVSTVPRRCLNKSLFVEHFQSSFRSKFWFYFIFCWTLLCLILVTIDHIVTWFDIQT